MQYAKALKIMAKFFRTQSNVTLRERLYMSLKKTHFVANLGNQATESLLIMWPLPEPYSYSTWNLERFWLV